MHIHSFGASLCLLIIFAEKYNSQLKTAFIMRQSAITVFAELTVKNKQLSTQYIAKSLMK